MAIECFLDGALTAVDALLLLWCKCVIGIGICAVVVGHVITMWRWLRASTCWPRCRRRCGWRSNRCHLRCLPRQRSRVS